MPCVYPICIAIEWLVPLLSRHLKNNIVNRTDIAFISVFNVVCYVEGLQGAQSASQQNPKSPILVSI